MRTSEFKKYLHGQIKRHGDSQNKGIRLVIDVLTTSLIDLEIFNLLGTDRLSHVKHFAQADYVYFKHFKRCCLIDLWSVAEIRIREIAAERRLRIKGRSEKVKELIAEAYNVIRSNRAKMLLKRAERKLGGKFIEFPSYLSAVLRRSEFGTEETTDWRKFFDIFRIMRNSVHNNFTCTETCSLQCRGYSKDFTEGQPVVVQFEDLQEIIKRLLEFLEKSNRRLGAG